MNAQSENENKIRIIQDKALNVYYELAEYTKLHQINSFELLENSIVMKNLWVVYYVYKFYRMKYSKKFEYFDFFGKAYLENNIHKLAKFKTLSFMIRRLINIEIYIKCCIERIYILISILEDISIYDMEIVDITYKCMIIIEKLFIYNKINNNIALLNFDKALTHVLDEIYDDVYDLYENYDEIDFKKIKKYNYFMKKITDHKQFIEAQIQDVYIKITLMIGSVLLILMMIFPLIYFFNKYL